MLTAFQIEGIFRNIIAAFKRWHGAFEVNWNLQKENPELPLRIQRAAMPALNLAAEHWKLLDDFCERRGNLRTFREMLDRLAPWRPDRREMTMGGAWKGALPELCFMRVVGVVGSAQVNPEQVNPGAWLMQLECCLDDIERATSGRECDKSERQSFDEWLERINRRDSGESIMQKAEEKAQDGDKPDQTGLVENPLDKKAYRPATKIVNDFLEHTPTYKDLTRILREHPEIRRWKPSKNRLLVHLGDWQKYVDSKSNTSSDNWSENPADVEKRKAQIQKGKARIDGK